MVQVWNEIIIFFTIDSQITTDLVVNNAGPIEMFGSIGQMRQNPYFPDPLRLVF